MTKRKWIQVLMGCLCIMLLVSSFLTSYDYYAKEEQERAHDRARYYQQVLASALNLFAYLPTILSEDPHIIASIADRSGQTAPFLNERLEFYAEQSDVSAVYLMDLNGKTIAASNWRQKVNYIGQNYGFRPYFKDALRGERGEMFAIGVTTKLPGLFLSEPVRDDQGEIRGVIAAKVELDAIPKSWAAGGERVYVTNADNVVVLASNPSWVFRSIGQLSNQVVEKITEIRQFYQQTITPLNYEAIGSDRIRIGAEDYFQQSLDMDRLGWQLHYITPTAPVLASSLAVTGFVAIPMSLSLFAFFFMRSRRVSRALQESQEDRRELRVLNQQLEHQISERRVAEDRLKRAQRDLARASKLAALGQLSASVTHELGQPISAMQNYLSLLSMDAQDLSGEHQEVVTKIQMMAQRMDHITEQLRFFAGGNDEGLEPFDMRDAIKNSVDMVWFDMESQGIILTADLAGDPIWVEGHQMRIEQVLVNLLKNSMDALQGQKDGHISLSVKLSAQDIVVAFRDNGPGIDAIVQESLFDPFVSTKASGKGMGLGLAISHSIVKEHAGNLSASSVIDEGAEFKLRLPLCMQADQKLPA